MSKALVRLAALGVAAFILVACVVPGLARESTKGKSRKTVSISAATVVSFQKFTARKSGREHIRFRFEADGKTSDGIIFQGDWTQDTVVAFQSKRVSMTGYWKEFRGKPSFVARKVTKIN